VWRRIMRCNVKGGSSNRAGPARTSMLIFGGEAALTVASLRAGLAFDESGRPTVCRSSVNSL